MQDMFENAKRVASTAVERAAWEADRVRRTSARQREIDLLKRERSAVVEQLAGVLLDLERRGELTQAHSRRLPRACGRSPTMSTRVTPTSPRFAMRHSCQARSASTCSAKMIPTRCHLSPPPRSTIACPSCGRSVRRSAAFCPACGTKLN